MLRGGDELYTSRFWQVHCHGSRVENKSKAFDTGPHTQIEFFLGQVPTEASNVLDHSLSSSFVLLLAD